jgi:hypothetical protein
LPATAGIIVISNDAGKEKIATREEGGKDRGRESGKKK